MNGEAWFREADFSDVELLVDDVRQADIDELIATSGESPELVMYKGLCVSTHAWVGIVDDVPICMFGVAPRSLLTGHGHPWMISTNKVDKNARKFARHSHDVIGMMRESYQYLDNWVDARNTRAIRWLKVLGFTIEPTVEYGVESRPFHHFFMGVRDV